MARASHGAAREEVRAREASALQAGLVPNPKIGLDVENFAGTGDLTGFDGSTITLELSQLIELGVLSSSTSDDLRVDAVDRGWIAACEF